MLRRATAPFPPVIWFAGVLDTQVLILEAQEHYTKQTWRNRLDIRGANNVQTLSLSVESQDGLKTPIQAIRLTDGPWLREHTQSIRSAYNSAPFADHYMDEVLELLKPQESTLYAYNRRVLNWVLQELQWNGELQDSLHFVKPEASGLIARFRASKWKHLTFPSYEQVFSERRPFEPNLSVLDVLFNLGPEARIYLDAVTQDLPVFQE